MVIVFVFLKTYFILPTTTSLLNTVLHQDNLLETSTDKMKATGMRNRSGTICTRRERRAGALL